jgi:3-oxoacyl-(acyl-carrier-protein) synthase
LAALFGHLCEFLCISLIQNIILIQVIIQYDTKSFSLCCIFVLPGPSYGLRNGCASGLLALDRAVASIRNGDCDTAIVAGCNLCLKPAASVQLAEMNLLSSDGQCRCFDENGNVK